jgi:hypothetical protein
MSTEPRTEVSDQFRLLFKEAAETMNMVLVKMAERDATAISIGTLRGALHAATHELEIRERALLDAIQFVEPQSALLLSLLETEAKDNLAFLRDHRKTA